MTDANTAADTTADAADLDLDAEAAALWAEMDEADGLAPSETSAETTGGEASEDFADEAAEVEGAAEAGAEVADGVAGPTGDDAAPAAEVAAPSMWDNAPAELRTEFERLSAENAKLLQKERSASGRATGFQRRYEELARAAQPRTVEGDRPTPVAALAALKEDYPEIAAPLEQVVGAIEGSVAHLSEAEEGRRKAAETELSDFLAGEEESLLAVHPDYADVLSTNAAKLVKWIDDQPRAVRDAFAANSEQITDAAAAATVISAFKDFLNPPAAAPAGQGSHVPLSDRRARQLGSTASHAPSSRRPTVSGIPENDDPQAIWDAIDAVEARR